MQKMKKTIITAAKCALVLALMPAVILYAQGNRFDKVRYNGGTLQSKVNPKDWNNKLTITSDAIKLQLKDGQSLEIPASSVTGISYGQEAHRRVGTMVALGILVAPLALFGLLHKTRLHYIGLEYTLPDQKKGGLLLQGDKNNYRAILVALKGSTGSPITVAEEDRKYVPATLGSDAIAPNVESAKDSLPASASSTAAQDPSQASTEKAGGAPVDPATAQSRNEAGTIKLTSTPDGAEVFVDSAFVGTTPAALKLTAGKHTIQVVAKDYKDWHREITVLAGSESALNAVPDKHD